MRPILFLPLALLACDGATQMSQAWMLDRVRLLGVRAEVDGEPDPVLGTRAEPQPGETVNFASLRYAPAEDPITGALWIACVLEQDSSTGCELDESVFEAFDEFDPETATEADFFALWQLAQDAGLIGFEPDLPPAWTVPEDALDGLADEDLEEGRSALVNIFLFTESTRGTGDQDAEEVAFKRVPVSEAITPNHNPDLIDFVVAGVALDGAAGFNARAGHTYTIDPVLVDGHVETYRFINRSGEVEWRREEPFFNWYTQLGAERSGKQASFDQEYSLHPHSTVEWTAPRKPGLITIHSVVRDRRGGMGWRTLTVNVL